MVYLGVVMIRLRGIKSLMTLSGFIVYELTVTAKVCAIAGRHDGNSMVFFGTILFARTEAFNCPLQRHTSWLYLTRLQ
jgi:hypothetical protein